MLSEYPSWIKAIDTFRTIYRLYSTQVPKMIEQFTKKKTEPGIKKPTSYSSHSSNILVKCVKYLNPFVIAAYSH